MIRRFNYTRRGRIPRERVQITLLKQRDVPAFDARLTLSDLRYPADAKIFVEAYYKSSYQRFPFGTVAAPLQPPDTSLSEVDRGNAVFFRVKVVDAAGVRGRIVAEIDDISGEDAAGPQGKHYCILPVNFIDLGEEVWRVNLDGNRPVLEVNKFQGAEAFVRSNSVFAALVYPEVVRDILKFILLDETWDGQDGASGWREHWLRFVRAFGAGDPPGGDSEEDDRTAWVLEAVAAFSKAMQFRARLVQTLAQEQP